MVGKLESHMKKNEPRLQFVPMYKNYFKMIKDLNIRSETINYIEDDNKTKTKMK